MALAAGTKLGFYEIAAQIGAGGMGEVYRARDTRLGRDVAIKVLPAALAHDPVTLSRFQREAKMLAAPNHPNIATIYGLEQRGDTSYPVMELAPGETLRLLDHWDTRMLIRSLRQSPKRNVEVISSLLPDWVLEDFRGGVEFD